MTTPPRAPSQELSDSVKSSWHRFVDDYEPLRPELYRYCRALTHSPWDAEDLVQDTLERAFVTLGRLFQEAPKPRAWLFRVASNLWVDRMRRARELPGIEAEAAMTLEEPRGTREAAGTLLVRLSPQERAAVVLKDVFELSLEEIALVLSTTVGAVKAALHRGRGKLVAPEPSEPLHGREPSREALDVFCDAFNRRDLERLTALLLDTATVEIVGLVTEYGPEAAAAPRTGSFHGMLQPLSYTPGVGGVEPRLLEGYVPSPPRAEVRLYRGEPILLYWYAHEEGETVRDVVRVEVQQDRLAHVRNYFFTPDVIAEVCRELDVPFRTNGYRYW